MAVRMASAYPQVTWWAPQLPPSPQEAAQLLVQGIADWPRATMAVMGSSLGGYYAAWLATQTGCRAVLLNPAIHPARDLARYIGEQTLWQDPTQLFFFLPQYVDELRALECPGAALARRTFAVIARGDEVLDWREMAQHYAGAHIKLLEAGDHALSDFDMHIEEILQFLDLPEPNPQA